MSVKIENWGRMPYREAWERQKLFFSRLASDPTAPEIVAVVEHNPVYTLGFHGNARNLLATESYLKSLGAECIRIERGGDITYHGPGQLVMYPLINLKNHRLGVRQYVEIIESSVVDLLADFGIEAASNNDAIGVWVDWGCPEARKICAIGVKISHGATMHGLALNVNTDLDAFSLINPCGFTDKGVTSMQAELHRAIPFKDVAARLPEIFLSKIL